MNISPELKLILGVLTVVSPLLLGGTIATLNTLHEPKGAVLKSDLRKITGDLADLQDLQVNAPSELYDVSRENKIRRLKTERNSIRDQLGLQPIQDFAE